MQKRISVFCSIILVTLLLLTVQLPALATENTSETSKSEELTPTQMLNIWYQLSDLLRSNGKYPFTLLRPGTKGYEVTCLQSRLQDLGYYNKVLDGVYGSGTETGMRAFERAHGLPVNGIASESDQRLLYSDSTTYNPGYSLTPKKPSATKKPGSTNKPGSTSIININDIINPDYLKPNQKYILPTQTPEPYMTLPNLSPDLSPSLRNLFP